jgi:3-oxoacyl-[acyl-carrier protein] reductase
MSNGRLSTLDRSIAGRVAIVTGAGSGIGRATAHLFADEGARVAVVDVVADRVDAVVAEITAVHGPNAAHGWVVDMSSKAAVDALPDAVVAHFGALDIVINNAGVSLRVDFDADVDAFDEAWDTTMAVNLTAYARLARAALPHLERSDAARIVCTASTEGLGATGHIPAYNASKTGVIGLVRALAVELGRRGITANAVCPGPIDTGLTADIPGEHKEIFARRRVPIGRYGIPEEIAHGMLNLVLPASRYMNGVVLAVDGGMTSRHT